tara:strand:+ start:1611 stop:2759 length:1149 start_codon:yes stop_codon:yes gene_type:complete
MAKLLYYVPEDYGFVSHRFQLAQKMLSMGHEVIVVTKVNEHAEAIASAGFKLVELGNATNKRHSNILRNFLKLILIYRDIQPDIVHHFSLRMIIMGTMAAKLNGNIRIINTITGLGSIFIYDHFRYRLIKFFVIKFLRKLLPKTYVTVQNRDDYHFIEKLSIPKINLHLILGTGVDVNRYYPVKKYNKVPIVILPSRMLWHKGIQEFVAAARSLQKKSLNCRFVLVGDSDDSNPSSIGKEQLFLWQEEGCIEWWGHEEDMLNALAKADIVCLPTYREGLPKSLLEAASSGIAIVATDVPGCREIVEHGVNGFLVPAKNSDGLSLALEQLISDRELRQKMGRKSREKILASLSSDIVINKTVDLYSDCFPNKFQSEKNSNLIA